ncbi:Kinesin-like protein KIF23 [Trichoplax sp. H2]|nr:Kinesin-like protein KIF23 [Trichoplax sp. H2]|eukprot:RDD46620.1 Kinesin-like protein KIF23 [Trichoplax sp. H2]
MTGSSSEIGVLPRCLDVLFNTIKPYQAKKCIFTPNKLNSFDIRTEAEASFERQYKATNQAQGTPSRSKRKVDYSKRYHEGMTVQGIDEDNAYTVFVSFVEIYNNYIYDLLDDSSFEIARTLSSKALREDSTRGMYISNVTEVEVADADAAYAQLIKGQQRRRVAYTKLNHESSRSHSIFNIRLIQAPLDDDGETVLRDSSRVATSQLSLVDLAGSERTARTNNEGVRLKEAGNINSSLMVLRTCMECLRDNQANQVKKIVPYRDSKLTYLFKSYFEGEGKVRLVICLNPQAADYDENLHVMKFASITQDVTVTRAKDININQGLTPGRRRANIIYKEVVKSMRFEDDGEHSETPFSLGRLFPNYLMTAPDDKDILPALMEFLRERSAHRAALQIELKHRAEITSKDREVQSLERKLKNSTEKMALLQQNLNSLETENKTLEHQIVAERRAADEERRERGRLKEAVRGAVFQEREKWEKECDKRVKATQFNMKSKLWETDEKLRLLREIVENTPTKASKPSEGMVTRPRAHEKPEGAVTRSRAQEQRMSSAKNMSDVTNMNQETPKSSVKSVKGREVKKYLRRSQPSDIWLEHKPDENVDEDTLLQLNLRKKKTVETPKVNDFAKAQANHYVLEHQEEDSQGEIETQLIKGDVFETETGGHSVHFTDVEVLQKRKSIEINARKRRSSEGSADWTDVETRCSIAIEGRPNMSPAISHKPLKSENVCSESMQKSFNKIKL